MEDPEHFWMEQAKAIEVRRVIQYKPLVDEAIVLANHKAEKVIVWQRPFVKAGLKEGRDFDYYE